MLYSPSLSGGGNNVLRQDTPVHTGKRILRASGVAAVQYPLADRDPNFDKLTFGLPVQKLLAPEFIRPGLSIMIKLFTIATTTMVSSGCMRVT